VVGHVKRGRLGYGLKFFLDLLLDRGKGIESLGVRLDGAGVRVNRVSQLADRSGESGSGYFHDGVLSFGQVRRRTAGEIVVSG